VPSEVDGAKLMPGAALLNGTSLCVEDVTALSDVLDLECKGADVESSP